MWGSAYWIINRANTVLDRVPPITTGILPLREPPPQRGRFLGANAYFNLVRRSGRPLLEHEVEIARRLRVYPRRRADVYALM